MTALDAALKYSHAGLPVFPVGNDKTPLTPHGFKDATTDEATIREWWTRWSDAGIGIPTGKASGIVVLDIDPRNGGEASFDRLVSENGPVPRGPVVRTGGGGEHRWFSHPGGTVPPSHGFLPGLDLQGDGAYVIVPPSPHKSGGRYEWVVSREAVRLPLIPPWLLNVAESAAAQIERLGFAPGPDGKVPHGLRHDYIVRLASSHARRLVGIGTDQLIEVLRADVSRLMDTDAKTDSVIREAARSALRKFGRPSPFADSIRPDTAAGGAAGIPAAPLPGGAVSAPAAAESRVEFPATGAQFSGAPKLWTDDGKWNHAGAVWRLLAEEQFCSFPDTHELLRYDDGVYNGFADAFVESWVERQHIDVGKSARKAYRAEAIAAVKAASYLPRESMNPPGLVNLADCVFRLEDWKPQERDRKKDRFTYRIPVRYDPSATCPPFLSFLEEVQPDPENRALLQEMVGYCLSPGNSFQTMFFNVGDGANGKSTFLSAIEALLGPSNCSHEPPQILTENRFSSAELYGKLANVAADIPLQTIAKTHTLKSLTGGDYVRAEKKGKHPFKYVNGAKLIFSGQRLPTVKGLDGAFRRRVLVIEWLVTIPPERRDPFLVEKMSKDLPGLLNWALEGRRRLFQRGRFAPGEAVKRATTDWLRRSASLEWFVEEEVVRDPHGWVLKDEFYARYTEFCDENGVPEPMTKQEIGGEIGRVLPGVRQTRPIVGTRREKAWKGIQLKEDGSSLSGRQGRETPDAQRRLDGSTGPETPPPGPDTGSPSTDSDRPARPGGTNSSPDLEEREKEEGTQASKQAGRPGREDPDPGDIFAGRATRTDRARAAFHSGIPGSADVAPESGAQSERKRHSNCSLCRDMDHHVCYACPACIWQEAHGQDGDR